MTNSRRSLWTAMEVSTDGASLKTVTARLLQGGVLWTVKGQEGVLADVHLTIDLRKEWVSHRPFGKPDRHSSFQPDRVAIETSDGHLVEERANPRESFRGHAFDTPWDTLQLAYFYGYAMWTYMNTPFLFALPGVRGGRAATIGRRTVRHGAA